MWEKRRAWVQGGLGASAALHARRLMGSLETLSWSESATGHAARAACFLIFFRRAFSVLVKDRLATQAAKQHLALSQNAMMV